MSELEKAAEFMAKAQAGQAGPNPNQSGNTNSDKKDDDVIDADFTEKKK